MLRLWKVLRTSDDGAAICEWCPTGELAKTARLPCAAQRGITITGVALNEAGLPTTREKLCAWLNERAVDVSLLKVTGVEVPTSDVVELYAGSNIAKSRAGS
jgi:hypothetical protein